MPTARTYRQQSKKLACLIVAATISVNASAAGTLKVLLRDGDTDQPVAARVELIGPRGRPVPIRRTIEAGKGYAVDGEVTLEVPSGNYQFKIIRGPQYRIMTGHFQIDRTAEDAHTVELHRYVDCAAENWLAGDLCVDRRLRDLPVLMRSEELDVVSVITSRADRRATQTKPTDTMDLDGIDPLSVRIGNVLDTRSGSGLLIFDAGQGLELPGQDSPSGLLIGRAKNMQTARVVVQNPFAWDLPIWLASGRVEGFALLSDYLQLDRESLRVTKGRPPNKKGFNHPLGPGLWADTIYQNLLDAGFRIPPVACSGAGLVKNPLGYNRVYVHCGDQMSADQFWNGLWQGKSVVTNGPLLRPRLHSKYPGHVFRAPSTEPLRLQMDMQLGTRDPVDYLEVIYNGSVIYNARLEEYKDNKGIIPPFTFDRSGWVIARVVTGYQTHYRAAVSAPWYIEFPGDTRISKRAVEFFQEWLGEREQMLLKESPAYLAAVAPMVRAARAFWSERAEQATDR